MQNFNRFIRFECILIFQLLRQQQLYRNILSQISIKIIIDSSDDLIVRDRTNDGIILLIRLPSRTMSGDKPQPFTIRCVKRQNYKLLQFFLTNIIY